VEIEIKGLPSGRLLLHHYRIGQDHSNSYAVWKRMGSPQNPTPQQYAELERAGQLQLFASPQWINTREGTAVLGFDLPRQGVSLLRLSW
jgi:xylan 1,4-beta-xylosidase